MSVTPEQNEAIKARGKVLVSASAGAGKTTVMIKRLADVLEEGASLDNVLAVTFTKKAAAQMKDKLRAELISRLNCDDEEKRENIRVQLSKVNGADISTIHSFCARLIRTYFYVLKVDASFEVLSDGAETAALQAGALDELFDELYKNKAESLYLLLEKLRKKRSDRALREMLLNAYDEVRKHPDYLKKLEEASAFTYTDDGFESICREYGAIISQKFALLADEVEAFEFSFASPLNAEGYFKILEEMRTNLRMLAKLGQIFGVTTKLTTFIKPKVRPETAEADAVFSAFVDKIKKRFRSLLKGVESEETERLRLFESGAVAKAFFDVLRKFDAIYARIKGEEGKLDYGDLEHFALALLRGEESDEDVRSSIREKYKFVFVDEYQDVNPIQDEIITLVGGRDVFCVGDLKQAIYGFRGSRSRFFAEKCNAVNAGGKYISLPDNFRSAAGVIDFVNHLFSEVMQPPLTEFDYADGHRMRGGARYGENYRGFAEICLFENEGEKKVADGVYSVEDQPAGGEVTAEGKAVLALIEEALHSKYYDPDLGREVDVQPGDICVLTRKRANKNALCIVRAVTAKYPVTGAAEVNICTRPEIVRLLDVLSFLDNGEQDIPLATALLSPLGNMTEADLAKIRIFGGTGFNAPLFRECCKKYAACKRDLTAKKLNEFYAQAERLRTLSCSIGAAWLIDEIVMVGNFAASFDTEQKLAALRRLQREAYAPSGELYLSAFLAKIRAGGFKVTAPASLAADCVKVMTMHASKGLEFPVVIIADIAAEFSGDERSEMPYAEGFGFAPRSYNETDRSYQNTLLRRLYKARKEREDLCNEINLFYVACTRAKYKLYMLCSKAEEFDKVKANFAENYAQLFDILAFTPRILPNETQIDKNSSGVLRVLDDSRADPETYEKLKQLAEFKYGFERGVDLPVKSSASRLIEMHDDTGNSVSMFSEDEGGGTGVDAGIAYHRYLQLCDFSVKDKNGIQAQIEKWLSAGLITESQKQLLNVEELVQILSMPAFEKIGGKSVYREREFICKLSSAEYIALKEGGAVTVTEDDGNSVIVQGAIDLLLVERAEGKVKSAAIIDYKYSARSDEGIKEKYAPQLALYRAVTQKIYGLPANAVAATVINIKSCRQIEMDN